MIEASYYYAGHLRWNLLWATPNYAGAFLATLLPLFWLRFSNPQNRFAGRLTVGLRLLFETAVWVLLNKTYSRGGLAAVGIACIYYSLFAPRLQGRPIQRLKWFALRAAIAVGCLLFTGFGDRVSPDFVASDPSVTNRLDLWLGGLKMLAASPWSGWGAGESGWQYMNWFQGLNQPGRYRTMVNSYLEIAVSHGLPALMGILAIALLLLLRPCRRLRPGQTRPFINQPAPEITIIAGAVLLAWLAANVFTTLYLVPSLWLLPGLAVLWLLAHLVRSWIRRDWHFLARCIVCALLGGAALFAVGFALSVQDPVKVRRISPLIIRLNSAGNRDQLIPALRIAILPDPAVLGQRFGRELRRLILSSPIPLQVTSFESNRDFARPPALHYDGILLFGDRVAALREPSVHPQQHLLIIHPTRPPPAHISAHSILLVLPEIDQSGLNHVWRQWAADVGAEIYVTQSTGTDIRSAWPTPKVISTLTNLNQHR